MKWITLKASYKFVLLFTNAIFATEVIECEPPSVPMNGTYSVVQKKYGVAEKIAYACDEGFLLLGDTERFCRTDKRWTGQVPFCDIPSEIQKAFAVVYAGQLEASTIFDNDVKSCFYLGCQTGQALRISLKAKAFVHAVKLYLPEGKYFFEISSEREKDKVICNNLHITLKKEQWKTFRCKSQMKTDEICIRSPSSTRTNWTVCEVQVYTYDESACDHPPKEPNVPNTQLVVSRKAAMLKCHNPKSRDHLYYVCEEREWKEVGSRNCKEEKSSRNEKNPEIIAVVIAVIVVLVCFLAVAVFIYKRTQNPVVLMVQPKQTYYLPGADNCTSHEESEYACVNYEEIPLTPVHMRKQPQNVPSSLPDLLVEYVNTVDHETNYPDGQSNSNYGQTMVYTYPQDSLELTTTKETTLKESSFYGE